jgi:hypothetical protein
MKKDSLGMKRYERFPKAFNAWWDALSDEDGYCGINEVDDIKHEVYLGWRAGRLFQYELQLKEREATEERITRLRHSLGDKSL